ncbi:NADP-dependent oxidoreductase domain-containing protein [Thelephora terrestris]|uniref:NADP-dependent oxidoreductase domain-containing protein n=1 Tax=Thelephora terrestris TaxID=56493 RepID=A0A9P6H5F2_9AGAM|nr:NADP-dependent oxidoreductase domain-containing protein [Thelephora terrestris]
MPFDIVTLNDGTKYPTLAFGTGSKWFGTDVAEYVEQALETGFSHIDTAAQWYRNEESVGAGLKQSGLARSDLYVTAKYPFGNVHEAITTSLKKLGLKQLDMYLIHLPRGNLPSIWKGLEQAQRGGLTKSIGVSNFTVDHLREILKVATVTPAVNQISFNPYNYRGHKELIKFAAEHGILLEAYSALAPITRYPGGPVDKPVLAAAKRLGATPAQVILAWVRSKGVAIVTTSATKEHLEEYLAVADLPPLTEEEIAAIDKAGANGPPSKFDTAKLRDMTALAFIAGALTYATVRWVF